MGWKVEWEEMHGTGSRDAPLRQLGYFLYLSIFCQRFPNSTIRSPPLSYVAHPAFTGMSTSQTSC
jgi:hypothetical protein